MKKIASLVIFLISAQTAFSSSAADAVELKVKGSIKPPSCAPSFGSGGIIDYGVIPASSLQADTYTKLGEKQISFTITCSEPIKIALKVSDNRTTSVSNFPPAMALGANMKFAYGLGNATNGKSVGIYTVHLPSNGVTADGIPAVQIFSVDGNKNWSITNGNGQFASDRSLSWASTGQSMSVAHRSVSGNVSVKAMLNKPAELPLERDVPLDGSATFEIVYL